MPTKRFQDKTSSWFKNFLCPSNHSFGIVVDDKNEVERCRMAEGWFFDITNYPVDWSKLWGCGIPSIFDSFTVYVDCIDVMRLEEHTSEFQSLMRISYAVFCMKKKIYNYNVFLLTSNI